MKEVAGREVGMDCSRAVCALYIVGFWHLSEYIGIDIWNSVTYQATHGVLATFTFISGYFLGKKKVESIKEIFLFYMKRLAGFYPLFIVACILLYRIGCIKDSRQLVLTTFGLSCFVPPAPMTAWYLCMLMNFYFITPIINSYATRKARWLIIAATELLLIVTVAYGNADMRLCFYWPFYSAGLLSSTKILVNKVNFKAILSAVIIFLGVSINIGNGIGIFSFITSGCIVVFMLNVGQILKNTVLHRSMMLISYASMCAYLFHRPIYSLASGYLGGGNSDSLRHDVASAIDAMLWNSIFI